MFYVLIMLFIRWTSGQNNFVNVRSCTDIKLRDIPEEVFEQCKEPGMVIHCLPDENDNLGLSCFSVTWIEAGRCPYYNSYQGNMDEKECKPQRGSCSPVVYKSPFSLKYEGCYKEDSTTSKAATTTETITIPSVPSPVNCTLNVPNRTKDTSSEDRTECSCASEIAVIITFVILGCGGVVLFVIYRKRRNTQRNKEVEKQNGTPKPTPGDDNGKCQPLLTD
uniref:Uncharacterized protein LOC111136659 n=1 Tax=Crassostrea virginica TaxID=6565 RepID=A0A8B8ETT6_CRAVI|nr:uncharacterized protein LOC111136659 [Crassostrea virginica]